MSAQGSSRSIYVLGPISLEHNTEKTLDAVRQQLSKAGEEPTIELESLRHRFFASNKNVKEVCCRMHKQSPGMSEIDKSGENTLDDDSMNAGQILAERQKQDEASGGAKSSIRPTLKSCIQKRQTLQESARKIFDTLLVIRPGHPSWGEAAPNVLHVISASTLPEEEADFEQRWRRSVPEEISFRNLLNQESSLGFQRLLSAHKNGEPWSMPDQRFLCDCVQGLWQDFTGIFSKNEEQRTLPLAAGPPFVNLDKEGEFEAHLPPLTVFGSTIVRAFALVTDNGDYTKGIGSSDCITDPKADTRDNLAGGVSN